MEVAAIEKGTAALRAEDAYEATLTLFPAPEPAAVLERYSASASQQQQHQPSISEQPSVQVRAGRAAALQQALSTLLGLPQMRPDPEN